MTMQVDLTHPDSCAGFVRISIGNTAENRLC